MALQSFSDLSLIYFIQSPLATDDMRVPPSEKIYSGLYEYHVPTNTWKKKRDDIAYATAANEGNSSKTLRSRSSHSMLFHPVYT